MTSSPRTCPHSSKLLLGREHSGGALVTSAHELEEEHRAAGADGQIAEAFFDPQHLPTDVVNGTKDGADRRIQSRAVSSAGQDIDSFRFYDLMA